MATTLAGQRFESVRAIGRHIIEDIELDRCTFVASGLVQPDDLAPSIVVRQVSATRCILDQCMAIGVRFENVTVDARP